MKKIFLDFNGKKINITELLKQNGFIDVLRNISILECDDEKESRFSKSLFKYISLSESKDSFAIINDQVIKNYEHFE